MKIYLVGVCLWGGMLCNGVCKQLFSDGLSIIKEKTIRTADGKEVELIKLTNANGMEIKVTNYAASLVHVSVPDKNGCFAPVVLGFDSVQNYLGKHPKLGATIGRFANRIRNAEYRMDGVVYHLEKNNKQHCIHGGANGFNRQIFQMDASYVQKDTATVAFKYMSSDGEGGFPGNLHFRVAYKLTNDNSLVLEYIATTDKPTVVNFTNHIYFNLSGCRRDVLKHYYQIYADSITPVDSEGIPTGCLEPIVGTMYDFTQPCDVEERVQLQEKGFDINYKLRKSDGSLHLAAVVTDSVSGRVLRAYTTEPGMQFYIPNSNWNYLVGHGGKRYGRYEGFCLEMQHFPDSPNNPSFPSTVLLPGETYRQTTVYKFEKTLKP